MRGKVEASRWDERGNKKYLRAPASSKSNDFSREVFLISKYFALGADNFRKDVVRAAAGYCLTVQC